MFERTDLTNCEIGPLVPANDERTDKTSDDHDLVDEDGPENRGPWHASSEQQVQKQEWCRDEPINVSNIKDLTVGTTDNGVVARELDLDGCEAQVRSHGEVSNACYEDNGRRNVVE